LAGHSSIESDHSGQLGSSFPQAVREMPELVAQVLLDLGATFVKFGQILSMRPDFVPPAYCNAFLKLVDDVPRLLPQSRYRFSGMN